MFSVFLITLFSFRLQCDGNYDKPKSKYFFQRHLISKFHEVAKNNVNGVVQHETMAFVIGIEFDGVYHSTEIVFPNQNCSCDMVEDIGQ